MIEFVKLFFTDAQVFVPVMLIGLFIALFAWAIEQDCKKAERRR